MRPWYRRLRQQEWADDAVCQNAHLRHAPLSPAEEVFYATASPEVDADEDDVARGARDIFFPPRIRGVYELEANLAKDYCFGPRRRTPCPVRLQCLLYAIDREEEHGIFGGMSHRERNALVRKAERLGLTPHEFIEQRYPDEVRTDFDGENN